MTNSLNSLHSNLWKGILIGFASLVLVYGILRVIPIIKGVTISFNIPKQEEIQNDTFVLKGSANHARALYINGRAILIDPTGEFKDEVILSPGINKVTVIAEDVRGNFHKKEFVMTGSAIATKQASSQVAQAFIKNDTN